MPDQPCDAIERVLAGRAPYDDLTAPEQAVVRVEWDRRISERIGGLNFTDTLRASGRRWSEADADGNVTVHDAGTTPGK